MKMLLISGHGAGDSGACGNGYKEADLTIEMVKGIKPLLEKYASVELYPTERNAYKDIKNGKLQVNFKNYDYVFEVHFNAANSRAKGTEVFVTSLEKSTGVEQKVVNNLVALGFTKRGVKVCNYTVIYNAKKKGTSSALLETCFIDNSADMKLYKAKKQQVFEAVANGIIEGFNLKKSSGSTTSNTKPTSSTTSSSYYAKYTGTSGSIVTALNSIKVDSSYSNRSKIAKKNSISNYKGTAEQNTKMLNLLKQGKLKKA